MLVKQLLPVSKFELILTIETDVTFMFCLYLPLCRRVQSPSLPPIPISCIYHRKPLILLDLFNMFLLKDSVKKHVIETICSWISLKINLTVPQKDHAEPLYCKGGLFLEHLCLKIMGLENKNKKKHVQCFENYLSPLGIKYCGKIWRFAYSHKNMILFAFESSPFPLKMSQSQNRLLSPVIWSSFLSCQIRYHQRICQLNTSCLMLILGLPMHYEQHEDEVSTRTEPRRAADVLPQHATKRN